MKKRLFMIVCLAAAATYVITQSACSDGRLDALVRPNGDETEALRSPLPPVSMLVPEIAEEGQLVYENKEKGERLAIDLSNLNKGFIAVRCVAGRPARLVLEKGAKQQTDPIPSSQGYTIFPLEMGDGNYRAQIFLHVGDRLYEPVLSAEFELNTEQDEYRYLITNHKVPYTETSQVAELARTLRAGASTEEELIKDAVNWIISNIRYTEGPALAEGEAAVTNLDKVLDEKEGICTDFAATFAALMRINRIPCKVVFGTVDTPGGLVYHAWNLLSAEGGQWLLYDTTFRIDPLTDSDMFHYREARRVY